MTQSLQCLFRMLRTDMPRASRIIIPGVAHHVTQRGNRQQKIFFSDDDRRAYVAILAAALNRSDTRFLAWRLMDNHIHLMLVPEHSYGLRATLSSTHITYAQRINQREQMTGHLFQGRYASFALDDRHTMVAARYIENNPVTAGIVKTAEDWRWSSVRAHIDQRDDGLADWNAIGQHVPNWRAMLVEGLEAGALVELHLKTGQPLGKPTR
jgi:putative transposase